MSFLLTNNTNAAVTTGTAIALGSPVHGCGKGISATASAVTLYGTGYYRVTADASITVTGATAETLSLNVGGVPVVSATATPTEAGAVVALPLVWVIRKACVCPETITFTASANGTADITVLVEKL